MVYDWLYELCHLENEATVEGFILCNPPFQDKFLVCTWYENAAF